MSSRLAPSLKTLLFAVFASLLAVCGGGSPSAAGAPPSASPSAAAQGAAGSSTAAAASAAKPPAWTSASVGAATIFAALQSGQVQAAIITSVFRLPEAAVCPVIKHVWRGIT
jgi:hypothetical protein